MERRRRAGGPRPHAAARTKRAGLVYAVIALSVACVLTNLRLAAPPAEQPGGGQPAGGAGEGERPPRPADGGGGSPARAPPAFHAAPPGVLGRGLRPGAAPPAPGATVAVRGLAPFFAAGGGRAFKVGLAVADAPRVPTNYTVLLDIARRDLVDVLVLISPAGAPGEEKRSLCAACGGSRTRCICLPWKAARHAREEGASHAASLHDGLSRLGEEGADVLLGYSSVVTPPGGALLQGFVANWTNAVLASQRVVGLTWTRRNGAAAAVVSAGNAFEWDSAERLSVRSKHAGAAPSHPKVDRELTESVMVSPLAFGLSKADFAAMHSPSLFEEPLDLDGIECNLQSWLVVGDAWAVTASFLLDTAPGLIRAGLQSLKNAHADIAELLEKIRAHGKFETSCSRADAEADRVVRRVEDIQREGREAVASCQRSNCGVLAPMARLEAVSGPLKAELRERFAVYKGWAAAAAASVVPLGIEAGWMALLNLSAALGKTFATSRTAITCCLHNTTDALDLLPLGLHLRQADTARGKRFGDSDIRDKQVKPALSPDELMASYVVAGFDRYYVTTAASVLVPRTPVWFEEFEKRAQQRHPRFTASNATVVWDAWCCQCCGFSNEWAHYLPSLEQRLRVRSVPGLECHCAGLSDDVAASLDRIHIPDLSLHSVPPGDAYIWVAHTPPVSFAASFSKSTTSSGRQPDYLIGRSMYEFSGVPQSWVELCNQDDVDELWVPSDAVKEAFESSGVDGSKLFVIPEALDTDFYDPAAASRVPLPSQDWSAYSHRAVVDSGENAFVFLSIFKWESRKGWDVLLRAYFGEFSAEDPVSLVICTWLWYAGDPSTWGSTRDPLIFKEFVESVAGDMRVELTSLPHVVVITERLTEDEMRSVYASANAFVLPTRGEGWGLPIIQAMAMRLPTITTGWGGATAFLTQENSFLINYRLVPVPAEAAKQYELHDAGLLWAEPDEDHLRRLMLYVFTHQVEAAKVARRARQDVVDNFGEEVVAETMASRLAVVERIVAERKQDGYKHQEMKVGRIEPVAAQQEVVSSPKQRVRHADSIQTQAHVDAMQRG
ncbi:glycosyl transferase [Diplonema papillatum]|nr:glycosyl transferase [Diplonema papillatum]